jgi:hypothetical protein
VPQVKVVAALTVCQSFAVPTWPGLLIVVVFPVPRRPLPPLPQHHSVASVATAQA